MNPSLIMSFVVTMIVSAILIPLVMKAGKELGIVAHKNKRTVHKVEVPRIGGYAIYISSLIGAVIFLKTDPQINAILIAGFLVFFVGLIDDVHDLSPKTKLAVELIAALIVIVYGDIYLKGFDFMPSNWPPIIPGVITVLWIVGITNAINLIDGLDGLSSGISIIVLFTVSMTSLTSGRTDIASLSLVLAGAIMGFLFYNFHPAKIFLGDCGALYIGFMISVISLLGFGYNVSTFFTLGAPIVVLMVLPRLQEMNQSLVAAAKDLEAGKSIDEIKDHLKDIYHRTTIDVLIDNLDCLVAGGRVSRLAGALTKLINLKLIIRLNEESLDVIVKGRSKKTFIKHCKTLAEEYLQNHNPIQALSLSNVGTDDNLLQNLHL